MEISLKLKNEKKAISLTDLLIPLNKFNHFVNELENIQIPRKRLDSVANIKNLGDEIIFKPYHYQNFIKKISYVEILKINKNSPTLLNLLLNVSPYVVQAINLLVESIENIETKLYEILNGHDKFREYDEVKKGELVKYFILFFRLLLTYFSIYLTN